jgi:hypothetical protein
VGVVGVAGAVVVGVAGTVGVVGTLTDGVVTGGSSFSPQPSPAAAGNAAAATKSG